ncbi:hypothetical protein KC19_2G056600 [Ceratodon purpureus]|uniref:Uncharacterized protein n=1 Tax=Ceratodon purpureus TaxID=3225 RepID=A0A8T0IUG5_CERPU|nr:hypothetical protein KC19_2G056600 [Ceratodon purpureus]
MRWFLWSFRCWCVGFWAFFLGIRVSRWQFQFDHRFDMEKWGTTVVMLSFRLGFWSDNVTDVFRDYE